MLSFMVQQGVLQTSHQECVSRWLGPALWQVAATSMESRRSWSLPQQENRWHRFAGGRFQRYSAYGTSYESRPTPQLPWLDDKPASQAVVLAPDIVPGNPAWDGSLAFEMLLVGETAIAQRASVLGSLAQAGDFCGGGVEGVPFELVDLSPPVAGSLAAECLPAFPDAGEGLVERLTVRLNSPLFLNRWSAGQSYVGFDGPRFIELFQAAHHTLEALFAQYAQPLEADTQALTQAAQQVACEEQAFAPFQQGGAARLTHQGCELRGLLGTAVFRKVPWSLIPWMLWGGRFRVGQHRVYGAGGWSLELG